MVTYRYPKIEGSRGFLVEQRTKLLAELCHRFEKNRCGQTGLDAGLRSVSIKTALSFHPALPPQNFFIPILHADTFDEDSPETTVFQR